MQIHNNNKWQLCQPHLRKWVGVGEALGHSCNNLWHAAIHIDLLWLAYESGSGLD